MEWDISSLVTNEMFSKILSCLSDPLCEAERPQTDYFYHAHCLPKRGTKPSLITGVTKSECH
ncbi:hypothetical protein T12_9097 [Trichinella patagoniensis]|uniref:Uncharacterized protein n=1 Tax=Trichinella patagoniensis TaxID=990121 RepID=A0A0V0YS09_9BILA|nr:hypothetical protein T12_9097 [Trichinella patagoniensis]